MNNIYEKLFYQMSSMGRKAVTLLSITTMLYKKSYSNYN